MNNQQTLIEACQKNGLKLTTQRLAIYQELNGDETHPTTEEIYKRVKNKYPAISFDTVNRTLLSFVDLDLLQTIETTEHAKRYDPDTTDHHHFICQDCGQITDFFEPDINRLVLPKKITEENLIISKKIIVSGKCKKCLKN
jgi:Fur family peroxide stress response transcriptional regulator